MKRWLPRLAFSLLIFGGICLYEAYRAMQHSGGTVTGRVALLTIGAAVFFSLGLVGIRERHRRP